MDYLYRGTALPCSGVYWVVPSIVVHVYTICGVSTHGHFNITHDFGLHGHLPGIVCLPGTLQYMYIACVHDLH